MPETFKCPSCSAPLGFEGSTFQKCKFCGSNIIVPSEVFQRSDADRSSSFDLSSLTGKALKIAEIQRLIQSGNKIAAIKIFRETFGTGLKESKEAVERMERGEGFDLSGIQIQTENIDSNSRLYPTAHKGHTRHTGKSSVARTLIILAVGIFFIIPILVSGLIFFVSSNSDKLDISKTDIFSKFAFAEEIAKFGGEGTGAGKFKDNRSIAVDGEGRVYSGNYEGGKIQVFDSNGKFLNSFQIEKNSVLKDLIADRRGNLYVVNTNGIFVYEGTSGKLQKQLKINRVEGLALSFDGKIFVTIEKKIAVFDNNLKVIKEIKDAAEQSDSANGFDQIAVDGNGLIYAVDSRNGDICKFSPEGKFLDRFANDLNSPNNIAISNKGQIFLSDTSKIHVFNETGKEINSFETTQTFGMAFNDADELFVASRPFIVKYKINPDVSAK